MLVSVLLVALGTALPSGAQETDAAPPPPVGTAARAQRLAELRAEPHANEVAGPALEHVDRALNRAASRAAAGDTAGTERAFAIADAALGLAHEQIRRHRALVRRDDAASRRRRALGRAAAAERALAATRGDADSSMGAP